MKEKLLQGIDEYLRKQNDNFEYVEMEMKWNPHKELPSKESFYNLFLLKMIYSRLDGLINER